MPDDGVSEVPDEKVSNGMDLPTKVAEQQLVQLAQTGNVAQNNFVTMQKLVDYDYLEGKRLVGLTEAVGVREVASKQNPAGPSSN